MLWKSSTMFGTCSVARVVDGTVPIPPPAFILHSLQTHLPFTSPCLPLILAIRGLHRNSMMDFLHPLLVFFPWVILSWYPLIRVNFWLSVSIINMQWPIGQWLISCLTSRDVKLGWWVWSGHPPPILYHPGFLEMIEFSFFGIVALMFMCYGGFH